MNMISNATDQAIGNHHSIQAHIHAAVRRERDTKLRKRSMVLWLAISEIGTKTVFLPLSLDDLLSAAVKIKSVQTTVYGTRNLTFGC